MSVVNTQAPNVFATPLIFTSEEAWGETDIESINAQSPALDERDIPGPISLAVAAENGQTGARLVVFGDSDFLSNDVIGQYGNRDFFSRSEDFFGMNNFS